VFLSPQQRGAPLPFFKVPAGGALKPFSSGQLPVFFARNFPWTGSKLYPVSAWRTYLSGFVRRGRIIFFFPPIGRVRTPPPPLFSSGPPNPGGILRGDNSAPPPPSSPFPPSSSRSFCVAKGKRYLFFPLVGFPGPRPFFLPCSCKKRFLTGKPFFFSL